MRGIAFGGGEARIIQCLKEHTRVGADRGLCRFGEQARIAFHLCCEGSTHLELRQSIGARTDCGQLLQDALTLGSELGEREVSKAYGCVACGGGSFTFGRGKKNQHLSSVPARRRVATRRSVVARFLHMPARLLACLLVPPCTREANPENSHLQGCAYNGLGETGRLGNREAHVLRGKSGLHSTGWWITSTRGNPQASATESKPPRFAAVRVKGWCKRPPAGAVTCPAR